MYKIGELSRLCKIPVKTLRFYDGEGLLVPDEVDRFTGYRYYRAARIADVNRIIALKELGFSLDEIRHRQNAGSPDELKALLAAKEAELKNAVLHAEASLSRLAAIRRTIEEGEIKMFDITIRKSDALRLAARRAVFKTKEEALVEIEKIKAELPKAIIGVRTVIINYETEYRESDFDLAACVEITGSLPKNCPYEDKTVAFPADVAVLV